MIKNSSEVGRGQTVTESWDMSDIPDFANRLEETGSVDVMSEMKFWSNEYNMTEKQFAEYVKAGLPEGYRETLKKYEDDIRFSWVKLQKMTNKAWEGQLIRSDYELADTQRLGVVEPEETVEAATGIFYEERAHSLNQAILACGQNEESQTDNATLRQTWRRVSDYIESVTDYEFKSRDYNAYQNMRRACHNRMIQQLNQINYLAEKYGTERFTARDFMTNDFYYDSKRDRGRSLNHRANYDRETVLAYFRTAFQGDFDRSEKKAGIKERGMIAGVMFPD